MAGINKSFKVGRATVTAVDEWTVPMIPYSAMLQPFDQARFEARRDLMPEGYSRDNNGMQPKIQNWLVQLDGRNIMIDSGFGNGKSLPGMPPEFSNLNTPFLQNLKAEGLEPQDIDTVMITHLHVDHVGWNTVWDGHQWVPNYINARHILTDVERHFWDTASPHYRPSDLGRSSMRNCFEQSTLPIIQEDLVDTVATDARIDDFFDFVPMPGHTPGQVAIKFMCDGEGVLFAGDAIHHPLQVVMPELCMVYDERPADSVTSRHRLLAMCADDRLILAPAHFTHAASRITRSGDGYMADNLEMASAVPA